VLNQFARGCIAFPLRESECRGGYQPPAGKWNIFRITEGDYKGYRELPNGNCHSLWRMTGRFLIAPTGRTKDFRQECRGGYQPPAGKCSIFRITEGDYKGYRELPNGNCHSLWRMTGRFLIAPTGRTKDFRQECRGGYQPPAGKWNIFRITEGDYKGYRELPNGNCHSLRRMTGRFLIAPT